MKKDLKTKESRLRPWWRPGPATVLAAVAAISLLTWQSSSHPSAGDPGRITYEADANGHLQRIDREPVHAVTSATLPRLWKPEVQLLLDRRKELQLTSSQVAEIERLNADWLKDKANIQERLSAAAGTTNALLQTSSEQRRAPLVTVKRSLAVYSRLSEDYDQRRLAFWAGATQLLTDNQRRTLDVLRSSSGVKL